MYPTLLAKANNYGKLTKNYLSIINSKIMSKVQKLDIY